MLIFSKPIALPSSLEVGSVGGGPVGREKARNFLRKSFRAEEII
jgi:hypothetical protein